MDIAIAPLFGTPIEGHIYIHFPINKPSVFRPKAKDDPNFLLLYSKAQRARNTLKFEIQNYHQTRKPPPSATIPHSFPFIPACFPVSSTMPHSRPVDLQALPYPLGIIPSFCVNAQKTLVMKEKVWALAQDSFHIRDENNVDVLQCKAKVFSLHSQKFFSDMQGNELWSLKHKPLSIPRQYYAERPDGQQVFHVQGHWHGLSPSSDSLRSSYTSPTIHSPPPFSVTSPSLNVQNFALSRQLTSI